MSDTSGFQRLWPTLFLRQQIPGSKAANKVLQNLLLEQESAYRNQSDRSQQLDLTTDYLSQDLLATDHPVIGWLKGCLNKSVADYLKEQGIDYDVNWGLQAWANINRRGDYHNLHNHPRSYLSGTYYVCMPDPAEIGRGNRSDLNPGAISFYDPRAQANMLAIRGDAQIDPEYRVNPEPGLLLLWPSFLHHMVHPNMSDQIRISVSFNVVLKWKDDYLPKSV